jgi:PAS domain S-box-containing protein
VRNSEQIISEIQELSINLNEMESGQRGFVITGNSKYLIPYEEAVPKIANNQYELKRMVGPNVEQQNLLDSIFLVLDAKVNWINTMIDIRKTKGFRPAEKMILTNHGEELKQEFRKLVRKFISRERQTLNQRIYVVQADYNRAIFTIVITIILALVMVSSALYFFVKDYNRRLHSKKKLLESENRIKKFLEALPVGVFVLNHEGKSYYSNSKANALFGTDLSGQGTIEDVNIQDLPEVFQTMKADTDQVYPTMELPIMRALQGEKDVCVEDLEMKGAGKRIPLRVNATSVTDSEGNIEYAIAVFEDITDSREVSRRLEESKKTAEQAVALQEAFLANVSHEIRTPMNAIVGFTNLLLKGNLNAKEKDYVQTIKSSGENLMRIINDILDISKMESGMMSFESQAISVSDVFSSLNAMLTPKIEEKNLTLSFHYSENIPLTTAGDPTRLSQILLNIIGNAIKFTNHGGIEVYADVVRESSENCEIVFSIYDTGIGIAEDKMNQIFERFKQAESHTTRHYGGTGLGLSIAKQLIELQGGWIKVSSELGVGSVFTFSIPFKKSAVIREKKSSAISEAEIRKLSEKRILLVEDNPINVKFIQGLFSEYNIDADHAAHGREAIVKLKMKNYDIVLMDIEMPEMNGYKATHLIRNELKSNVPIIAMTANAMAGEKEKCLSAGMNAYLSKPIHEDQLFEKMVNLLAEKSESLIIEKETEKLIKLDFLVTSMRGKKQLILETLDVFFKQIKEDLFELNNAFSINSHDAIKRISHRMKSTVSIIGAKKLETILNELESLAIIKEKIANLRDLKYKIDSLSVQAINEVKLERVNYI